MKASDEIFGTHALLATQLGCRKVEDAVGLHRRVPREKSIGYSERRPALMAGSLSFSGRLSPSSSGRVHRHGMALSRFSSEDRHIKENQLDVRVHSFRATPGPVIRLRSGNVNAMIPSTGDVGARR